MLSLLSDITTQLNRISDTPDLDASVLLANITQKPRTWILAHPELTLAPEQRIQLEDSLTRFERGEPFPYVLGQWEFFGLEFEVTPNVLIPRPETELLIEKSIAWLQQNPERRSIADVGTGSGAIAISLAANVSNANIFATDISSKALHVAKRNAKKHGVNNRINFIECNLLPDQSKIEKRKSSIDLLCANLPYIPSSTLRTLPIFNREPTLALDGGHSGFDLIEQLMQLAPQHLAPQALLLFEIESTLGDRAIELATRHFPRAFISLHEDLTGRNRLLEIQT